uniref:Uncharacterized protein n=1 Tax=Lepeophtheirus salmonis TaxID=72036 RepID=A0A0K2T837_LEPSM
MRAFDPHPLQIKEFLLFIRKFNI